MTRELFDRIALAFYIGAATVAEQDLLNTAAASPQVRTADDLPEPARLLLADLEQRDRRRPAA